MSDRERFSHPYKECFIPFSTDVAPWRPASLLTHRLLSAFDTICNTSSSSLTIYCPLWPITYRRKPYSFKTCLLGRSFHTLLRNVSFPSPTDVGSHNPPPWGPASSLTHCPLFASNTICNTSNSSLTIYCPLWPIIYHRKPHSFKMYLLRRGFHTFIRNVLFPSPIEVVSQSTPLGASIFVNTSPDVCL